MTPKRQRTPEEICTSKTAYFSEARAMLIALGRSLVSGEDIHYYPCPCANHFHIGHRKTIENPRHYKENSS